MGSIHRRQPHSSVSQGTLQVRFQAKRHIRPTYGQDCRPNPPVCAISVPVRSPKAKSAAVSHGTVSRLKPSVARIPASLLSWDSLHLPTLSHLCLKKCWPIAASGIFISFLFCSFGSGRGKYLGFKSNILQHIILQLSRLWKDCLIWIAGYLAQVVPPALRCACPGFLQVRLRNDVRARARRMNLVRPVETI